MARCAGVDPHRSAEVQILVRDGRHVDDSLDPLWQQLSEEGSAAATMVGAHLMATGQLRDDIELDEVRDVLWNYLMINTYEALVLERGGHWTGTRTGWRAQSLPPSARRDEGLRGSPRSGGNQLRWRARTGIVRTPRVFFSYSAKPG